MKVKCYLAEGNDVDKSMMELLALTHERGNNALGGLANFRGDISLSINRSALIMVGGRESIMRFLYWQGGLPLIIGGAPFLVSFARKHKVFGKNETCVKIVAGTGHRQPEDGSEFIPLGKNGNGQLTLTPPELGHCLHFMYGWG